MMRVLCLLLLLLTGFVTDCYSASNSCDDSTTSTTKYKVVSRRNQTGHWTTQLHMGRDAGHATSSNSAVGPWNMDIEHKSTLCDGTESIKIIAQVTAPPVRVGKDYDLVPRLGYYKVHPTPADWMSARRACEQEGAHLVIINSEREAAAVVGLVLQTPTPASGAAVGLFYVGANDIYDEGNFVTVFGEPLAETGFYNWDLKEPNNSGDGPGEDCVVLTILSKLNDVRCVAELWYVCEQELY